MKSKSKDFDFYITAMIRNLVIKRTWFHSVKDDNNLSDQKIQRKELGSIDEKLPKYREYLIFLEEKNIPSTERDSSTWFQALRLCVQK
jgi:hypothetical protein